MNVPELASSSPSTWADIAAGEQLTNALNTAVGRLRTVGDREAILAGHGSRSLRWPGRTRWDFAGRLERHDHVVDTD